MAVKEESEGINVIERFRKLGYKTIAMALTEDSVGVDSLNVAAASAISFWEIAKKCHAT